MQSVVKLREPQISEKDVLLFSVQRQCLGPILKHCWRSSRLSKISLVSSLIYRAYLGRKACLMPWKWKRKEVKLLLHYVKCFSEGTVKTVWITQEFWTSCSSVYKVSFFCCSLKLNLEATVGLQKSSCGNCLLSWKPQNFIERKF